MILHMICLSPFSFVKDERVQSLAGQGVQSMPDKTQAPVLQSPFNTYLQILCSTSESASAQFLSVRYDVFRR
jgi:hypothetical protein